MLLNEKKEVNEKLRMFQQARLRKGELVLLGVAIGNALPIPALEVDLHKAVILNGGFCERVCYQLTEHATILSEDIKLVRDIASRHVLWRAAVASGKAKVTFSGEACTVIDDITAMPNYIEPATLCTVSDVVDRANTTYAAFTALVAYVCNLVESEA